MELAKKPTETKSRLPLLVGLAIVLASLVLWDRRSDWSTPRTGERVQPEAAAKSKKDLVEAGSDLAIAKDNARHVNPLASLALDQLRDTIRRPLFEERRRPVERPAPRAMVPVAPTPAAPRRTADPKALTLLGVLLSEGRAIALLNRKQTGQIVRAQEGDTIDGWTIERIEARHVVLRHGDTTIALQMFRKH